MFLFIHQNFQYNELPLYSNTSHVLIYRNTFGLFTAYISTFKYISCSYLSYCSDGKFIFFIQFKYISCSYLSRTLSPISSQYSIQIHLMFLFIRIFFPYIVLWSQIQIHLMFLFIYAK